MTEPSKEVILANFRKAQFGLTSQFLAGKIPQKRIKQVVERVIERHKTEIMNQDKGTGIEVQSEIISELLNKPKDEVLKHIKKAIDETVQTFGDVGLDNLFACSSCASLFNSSSKNEFVKHAGYAHPKEYEQLCRLFEKNFPSQPVSILLRRSGLLMSDDLTLPFIEEKDKESSDFLKQKFKDQLSNQESYVDFTFDSINSEDFALAKLTLKFPERNFEYIFRVSSEIVKSLKDGLVQIISEDHQTVFVVMLESVMDVIEDLEKLVLTHDESGLSFESEQVTGRKLIHLPDKDDKARKMVDRMMEIEKSFKKPRFRTYEKAKEYAHNQNLHSRTDWINHTKETEFPDDIPVNPHVVYKNQGFIDYPDFCGYERTVRRQPLTKEVIHQVLKQLRERWDYYMLYTDGLITDWFATQGLFGIKDPIMKTFFTEFISWRHRPEGREAIKYWLRTSDFQKEFKGGYSLVAKNVETKEDFLDRQVLKTSDYIASSLVEEETMGIERIMLEAKEIVPTINDKRWFDTQVNFTVKLIWQRLFDNEDDWKIILGTKQTGNIFHDEILRIIKKEFEEVRIMNFDSAYYTFKFRPTLFQKYSAWVMRSKHGFLNMGGTGSGKTGAAVIATKATRAKHVLIICPNNIMAQWVRNIKQFYGNSFVSEIKKDEYGKYKFHKNFFNDAGIHTTKYQVVNYDKMGRRHIAETIINEVKKGTIDFVILDEAQLIKKRDVDETYESTRRKNIALIIDHLREKNRKIKVMMLSATPIINNIREGISLLNMLTGTQYNISTHNTLRNAMRLYTEFQPFSLVYTQKNNITQIGRDNPIVVDAFLPSTITDNEVDNLRWVDLEYYCTIYRIPKILEILRATKGKTVIYTDYVGYDENQNPVIVNLIKEALEKFGYRVGLFIGQNKEGLIRKTGEIDTEGNELVINPFVNNEYDVVIVSRPFAIGIDEVQWVANNLIFNGLVWTWAEFEQIIGRLARTGQKQDHVNIYPIMARLNRVVGGEQHQADYDMKVKYFRILHKKEIGDCVRFGTLPEKVKFGDSKRERMKKLIEMLKTKKSGLQIKEIKLTDKVDELEAKIALAMTTQQQRLSQQDPSVNF